MPQITRTVLYTDVDGRARFRDEIIELCAGSPAAALSPLASSGGYQWRWSPAGFESRFHCTEYPQWLIVLRGRMEIGLQDGSTRIFGSGESFLSADLLPEGTVFDPSVHGHRSRALDEAPLETLFVRV